ncbi:DUF2059 domain-containing protein [Brevundimonas sp.]|uniref:DUF2059 domain-containing protein n=1 Tax=Brevundimonas sp. TaxID=1871086 RepID=UPI0026078599|nr:DUF2059 domain-containing protein [Brevundimonas sp.]
MRTILIALMAAGLCALAPGALAQDADIEVRAALAERLIDATARDGLDKMMDEVVARQLEAMPNLTEEQRAWNVANVPTIMERHITVMIDDMERQYAETFTTAELRALVEFYETPEGRVIAAKQTDVGARQGEGLIAFMQAYVADYLAKYCAAFDCPGPTSAAEMGKGAH